MSDYSIIILGYKQDESLRRCVALAIRQTDPAPAEVLVWHNWPSSQHFEDVTNIYSNRNFGCSARHALATLLRTEVVVFVDDDVYLRHDGICGRLSAFAGLYPQQVIGIHGRQISRTSPVPYSVMPDVLGTDESSSPIEVDMIKGLFHAVNRRSMLEANYFGYDVSDSVMAEDDIMLSAAMSLTFGKRHLVIPFKEQEVELSVWPGALQERSDHFERRDATCLAMMSHGWKVSG